MIHRSHQYRKGGCTSLRCCRQGFCWNTFRIFTLFLLLIVSIICDHTSMAWEWSDYTILYSKPLFSSSLSTTTTPISIQEISEYRVRDIKRRLSRIHGYSTEELNRILDKKELIQLLAFEEEKVRLKHENIAKRLVLQQSIIVAIMAILITLCWPLFIHAYDVISINCIVFYDRKKVEIYKCYELQCYLGFVGVILMGILDILQIWLTTSVILSWITTSKYFFPIPHLSIRPALLMGGDIANTSLANYGINIGSILVTYGMRYIYGKIEQYTGHILSKTMQQKRRKARQNETIDEKIARKAAQKTSKFETRQQQQELKPNPPSSFINPSTNTSPPPGWISSTYISPMNNSDHIISNSRTHQEFLNQLSVHNSDTVIDIGVVPREEIKTTLNELD